MSRCPSYFSKDFVWIVTISDRNMTAVHSAFSWARSPCPGQGEGWLEEGRMVQVVWEWLHAFRNARLDWVASMEYLFGCSAARHIVAKHCPGSTNHPPGQCRQCDPRSAIPHTWGYSPSPHREGRLRRGVSPRRLTVAAGDLRRQVQGRYEHATAGLV